MGSCQRKPAQAELGRATFEGRESLPPFTCGPAAGDNLNGPGAHSNILTLRTLKPLFLPGGVLLLCAGILFGAGLLRLSAPAVQIYYYAVFFAGVLLAWRFHSSRTLFALVTILLAYRAMEFFSSGRPAVSGPGRIAVEAVAVLIPLNFIFIAFVRERGLRLSQHCVAYRAAIF